MMRSLLILVIVFILSGCRSSQEAFHAKIRCAPLSTEVGCDSNVGNGHVFSIEEIVELGLATNPGIKSTQHTVRSLKHRIPQELSLPDPVVNTTTHLAPIETAAGRQAFALGISQKFVDVDRRSMKAAIANDEVCAAQADLIRQQQELAEQIRVACSQFLAIQETIRITRKDLESLEQIEEIVLRQYEVKKAVSQQDVLSVQIEMSRVENQLADLLQKEKSFSARIARLAHFEPGTLFSIEKPQADAADAGEVDALIAEALASRPELACQLARIRKERRKICLANLQNTGCRIKRGHVEPTRLSRRYLQAVQDSGCYQYR